MGRSTTTIQISKSLRDKLKAFGKKGETYDEIIRRLLKLAEAKEGSNYE
ncbi:MAG: DUF7557 family protein [Thermoproteota archaeon]|jgi:transcriptional regulator